MQVSSTGMSDFQANRLQALSFNSALGREGAGSYRKDVCVTSVGTMPEEI